MWPILSRLALLSAVSVHDQDLAPQPDAMEALRIWRDTVLVAESTPGAAAGFERIQLRSSGFG